MEAAAQGFAAGLTDFEKEPEGVVRLTAPPGLFEHLIVPNLPNFLADYPAIRLDLTPSVDYLDLARREADIALRLRRPDAGDVIAQRLLCAGYTIAVAKGAIKDQIIENPGEFKWISWSAALGHLPEAKWVRTHVPEDRVVIRATSMIGMVEAVRSGIGMMLMSRPYALLLELQTVDCLPEIKKTLEALPPAELWIAGHTAYRNIPRIAAVWDWLVRLTAPAREYSTF
jgi:DNA-binding transcriptional LysR family regulator